MSIVPGTALPPSGDVEPNADEETASPVRGAFSISGDLQGDTDLYAWTIDEADAGRTWLLRVQGELGCAARPGHARARPEQVSPARSRPAACWSCPTWPCPRVPTSCGSASPPTGRGHTASMSSSSPRTAWTGSPTTTPATAQPLDPADPFARGRLARESDRDHFRLTVDEAMASHLVDVRLMSRTALRRQVCISDAEGGLLQCREGTGPIVLGNLVLPAGTYDIEVSGEVVPWARYLLRVDTTSEPAAGFEREPNDLAAFATPLDPSIPLRGTSIAGDDDVFRIAATGAAQLWDIRATGTGISGMSLIRADDAPLVQGAVATRWHCRGAGRPVSRARQPLGEPARQRWRLHRGARAPRAAGHLRGARAQRRAAAGGAHRRGRDTYGPHPHGRRMSTSCGSRPRPRSTWSCTWSRRPMARWRCS